jgi:uncharacterized protein YukE
MYYVSNVVGDLRIDDINLKLSYMELIELSSDDFKASHRLRNALRNKEIVTYDPREHKSAKKNIFSQIKQTRNIEIKSEKSNESHLNFSEITELQVTLSSISKKMEDLLNKIDSFLTKNEKCAGLLEKTLEANQKIYEDKLNSVSKILEKNIEDNQKTFESTKLSYESKIEKLNQVLEYTQKNLEFNRQGYDSKIEKLSQIIEKNIDHNQKLDEKFKEYLEKETKVSVSYQNPALDILINKLDTLISSGIKVQGSNFSNNQSSGKSSSFVKEDIPIFVPEINSDDIKVNVMTKEEKSEGTESILEKLKKLKN